MYNTNYKLSEYEQLICFLGSPVTVSETFAVYNDPFPVSPGHLIYVPFDYNNTLAECFLSAYAQGKLMVKNKECTGFNVGLNYGKDAGEFFDWPVLNLIPRREYDCNSTAGGVRKVIDGQGDYIYGAYFSTDPAIVKSQADVKKLFEAKHSHKFADTQLPGWFYEDDIEWSKFIAEKLPQKGVLVEIGSFLGSSASHWATNLLNLNKDYKIYCVDPFDMDVELLDWMLKLNKIDIPPVEATHYDYFKYFTKAYPNIISIKDKFDKQFQSPESEIDCVFEDGEHTYQNLSFALPFWWDKIKIGGILCGHNYNIAEVKQAVDEFATRRNLQVNTFKNSLSWHIEKLN